MSVKTHELITIFLGFAYVVFFESNVAFILQIGISLLNLMLYVICILIGNRNDKNPTGTKLRGLLTYFRFMRMKFEYFLLRHNLKYLSTHIEYLMSYNLFLPFFNYKLQIL